jgi:hypothetical protein
MKPNLYQPKSSPFVTITLEFLDKYGMQLRNCEVLVIAGQPRPTIYYKVYVYFQIQCTKVLQWDQICINLIPVYM